MAVQLKMINKCRVIEQAVMEWFGENPTVSQVAARDLMDFFVKKKIFESNKSKGAAVNMLLNRLYEGHLIEMVPHAFNESKGLGWTWYFQRLPIDSLAQNGTIKKILMLEEAVKEWFADNPAETKVPARNLMELFMKKKILGSGKYGGQEITQMLNRFQNGNLLHMLPHALNEGKGAGSQWFFQRLASDGAAREHFEARRFSPEVERYRSSLLASYKE